MSTVDELLSRKSVRVFEDRPIPDTVRETITQCVCAAPTAGGQMLYTVLDITDPTIKATLAQTCDHQPFIAAAPMVWVFLADCRRWFDAYTAAGCEPRKPGIGDLILACEDTMIAAQNAVTAAQSLGLGSCYIGDIIEQRETVTELLHLDPYVFPISLVIFGYPTSQQLKRRKPQRFDQRFIFLENIYHRPEETELRDMFTEHGDDFDTFVPAFYRRKYDSAFSAEMTRSVRAYIEPFLTNE